MKKAIRFLFLLLLCQILVGIGGERKALAVEYNLIVASDLHYIAPSLTDGGDYYQRVIKNGDSKFMPYVEAITEAFLDEVLEARPEALLLTGDLTFNGAVISHEALIEKLRAVEAAGIPVLVLTGNHDVYNSNAARYHGDSFTRVPSATTDIFANLYADFGLNEALSVDSDSLSYIYPLNENTRLLMLDLNTDHDSCGLSAASLHWIEQQLKEAQVSGINILAAGHQNLFQHSIFRGGYVIQQTDALAALFERYGVCLYLSGHMHIQHIEQRRGITEIATSALPSFPCQYAVLQAENGQVHYETRRLDMAAWAEKNGLDDPIYLNFAEAAAVYMDEHFTGGSSAPPGVKASDGDDMLDFLRLLNRAYFSGDLSGVSALDPDGRLQALWIAPGDLTSFYVSSIQPDIGQNFNIWDSPEKG